MLFVRSKKFNRLQKLESSGRVLSISRSLNIYRTAIVVFSHVPLSCVIITSGITMSMWFWHYILNLCMAVAYAECLFIFVSVYCSVPFQKSYFQLHVLLKSLL